MAPIVPPADNVEPKVTTSMRIRPSLIRDLDWIAERTGRSRNEVIEFILQWGAQESRREIELQEKFDGAKKMPRKDK